MFIFIECNVYLFFFMTVVVFSLVFIYIYALIIYCNSFIELILTVEVLIFLLMLECLFCAFFLDNLEIQIFVLFILVVSSCEAVIGLVFFIVSQRLD
jgi:NADH:ubiquinone oxidoreductase subunit K